MTHIQAVFYGNPDRYPPILNSIYLLSARGFTIELICHDTGESPTALWPENCQVKRLAGKSNVSWRNYLGFVRHCVALTKPSTDLFVAHDMHGLLPTRVMASRCRRPLVYHSHELVISGEKLALGGRVVFAFQKRFAKTADLVVTADAERSAILKERLRLDKLPLVAANAPLQRPKPDQGRLQKDLAQQGRVFDKIMLRQGNVGPGHAVEATIRSIPCWLGSSWGFILLGPIQTRYIDELNQLAVSLGVQDRLAFLPSVPYQQVLNYTVGADVGHALYDPIDDNNRFSGTASNKLLEYMAAGLPILVSDRPGLRKLIERYDCGLTADESDPVSIAAAVNSLLGNPERVRRMGANAARTFEEEFRYDRQFAPVLAALESLISTRKI